MNVIWKRRPTLYVARLNQTDGTITWQTKLPFQLYNYDSVSLTKIMAVGATGAVYVGGKLSGTTTAHRLCKLAAADGTVTWAINPLDSAAAAFSRGVRQVEVDSSGNALVAFVAENPSAQALYKFASADGSLTWARKFAFPVSVPRILCAVDPSDNVYVAGWGTGAIDNIYVLKLSSAGATSWDETITLTDTGSTVLCGSMAADASNVYIGSYVAGASSTRSVIVKLPAAGNAVAAVGFVTPVAAYQDGMESVTAAGGFVYGASYDQVATYNRAAIYRYDPATSGPADFGAYQRIGVGYSIAAGSTTVSTITPTMPANPTVTPAAVTMTNAAGSLLSTLYEEVVVAAPPLIRFAHSLFPAARFGTPRWVKAFPASSLVNASNFGAPALDYNLEPQAHSLLNVSRFGEPYAFQYLADPGKRYAQALLPQAQFGTPSALVTVQGAATSLAPQAQFGAPLARLHQAAGAWTVATAFGAPSSRSRYVSTSLGAQARFGAPSAVAVLYSLGFKSTRFGTPRALVRGAFAASPLGPTANFGTPAARLPHQAAVLMNRTRFGTPRIIQAC